MSISIVNDGVTIKITEADGTVRNLPKPYIVTTSGDRISLRNDLGGYTYLYTDITTPSSANIDSLRSILEGYCEADASAVTTTEIAREQVNIAQEINVASAKPFGDYRFTNDLNPTFFTTLVNATGTVTNDTTFKSAKLLVAASGDYALISTYQSHPYYAGFPSQIQFTTIGFNAETNVEKEVFYGHRTNSSFSNGRDGFRFVSKSGTQYLEVWNNGSAVASVARASWTDPLDGTGVSGVNLGNFSHFCVFEMEFLWLGGAGLALYCFANGRRYLAHLLPWSYSQSTLIIRNPQGKIQAGIIATGAASTNFHFICSTYKSSGDPNEELGDYLGVYTGNTTNNLGGVGVINALIGFKLKSTHLTGVVVPRDISVVSSGATDIFRIGIRINPTLSSGTFTYADETNACVQSAKINGGTLPVMTGGRLVWSHMCVGRAQVESLVKTLRTIGSDLAGTADTMVLCVEQISGGTISVHASFNVKMKY